ncbi:MAG: hypothetical protein WC760_05030 [Bacteroidia bacterium]|jgi:hypothetical protein
MKRNYFTVLLLLAVLLITGCEKRYWYRKKVREPLFSEKIYPRRTVKIEIRNESPDFISKRFEQIILRAGMKTLSRKGFMDAQKDTPNLHLVISLRVDSYYVYGSNTGAISGFNQSSIVTRQRLQTQAGARSLKEKRPVKELTLSYYMTFPVTGIVYWESGDGLYFFNDEKRDLRRSLGMVRYALGTVE